MSPLCAPCSKVLATRPCESHLQAKIEKQVIPGYEPDPRIKAEPVTQGRGQRPKNKRSSGTQKRRGGGAPRKAAGKRRGGGGRKRRAG